jgi:AcrR family transcriptional regulator
VAPTTVRGDQRQQLIDTAAQLFADRGYDEVTMAQVAAAAGVARATVFNHFPSKATLLEAITETVVHIWGDMLESALADTAMPVPTRLRRLCAVMGEGIEGQRELHRHVFREIARIQVGLDTGDAAARSYRQANDRLLALMVQGQSRGELQRELGADALAAAFHALVNGTISTWLYHDRDGSLPERLAQAVEVFLAPVEQPTRPNGRRAKR